VPDAEPPGDSGPAPGRPPIVAGRLRPRDAAALNARPGAIRAHGYEGGWYNNATFVFPALASLLALVAWPIAGAAELLGIGLFFLGVTGVMLPLVALTWRRTPTLIVLDADRIEALHQGEPRQALAWDEVNEVRRVETMGNVRWYVISRDGDHLTLEGEIADLEALLAAARRLAGLPAAGADGEEDSEADPEADGG
jgi:hypothetical protein